MVADYTLSARITADAKSFRDGLRDAQNSLKSMGQNVSDAGKKITRTGATVTAMTAPLALFAKQSFDIGKEFRSSMSNVQALSGATESELRQLEAAARDMGKNTRFSASQAADGLGYMSLAGWDAQASMMALPAVLNLAVSGNMDLANASDIVTDSMTAFNLEAKDAERFTDGMAYAQANSNTTVEALGEAFKQSASSATAANQSYETTTALLGVLADAGVKGSAAGTGLNAMFRDLRASAEDGAIAVGDSSVALYDAEGNMRNVTDVLADMEKGMANMTQEQRDQVMSSIFQQQSLKAVNTLFGQGTDAIYELTEGIENSSGAASEMAAVMDDNMEGSILNLQSSIGELQLRFFELTEGPIRGFIDRLGEAVDWISSLDDRTLGMVTAVGAFLLALGPVLMILGLVTQGVGGLISAFAFLMSPIGLVIGVIAVLAGAFTYFMATNDEFRVKVIDTFNNVRDTVSTVVGNVITFLQDLWTNVQPIISRIGETLGNVFSSAIPFITSSLQNIWGQIQEVFTTIQGIVEAVWPVFSGFFNSFAEGFNGAGEVGSNFALNLTSILFGLNPVIKGVIYLFTEFGSEIVQHVQTAIDFILPLITSLGTAFGEIANVVIPMVMNVLGTLIPVVMQVGSTFMNIISMVLPVVINLFTQLVPILSRVVQWFAGIIGQVVPLVGVFISSLLPVIQNVIAVFMNIVSTVAPAVIAIFGAIMSTVEALTPVFMGIVTTVVHVFSMIVSTMNPLISFFGGLINGIMAVVSPLISFFASTISMIMSVIRPIAEFVNGIFNTIVSIISGTWSIAMNVIATGITAASGFIGTLSATVSNVFTTISSIISRIMNGVSNTFRNVFQGIQNAWSGLTGFVNGIFSGIQSSVERVVGAVTGNVNKMIGGINSAIGLINKIPGVNIGKIPMLYRGTDDFEGGFARINEAGRGELVNLPNGAQVIPHDLSKTYAKEAARVNTGESGNVQNIQNEGNVNVTIQEFHNHTEQDVEQLSHDLAWLTQRDKGRLSPA